MVLTPTGPPAATGGCRRRPGLSLLEVLVALAIFLFSLVALGQLVTLGSDRAMDVQWLSEASLLAQGKMGEVIAGAQSLTAVPESSFDEDPDYSWSLTAEADNTPGLYRVTVTVSRPRRNGSRFETTLSQLVLDPTMRGNTDGSSTGTDDPNAATGSGTTGGTGTGGGP
jgi:prepilin-type N-terminal cleavage/methylation domain-containing protein